jgi:hypothetical protein
MRSEIVGILIEVSFILIATAIGVRRACSSAVRTGTSDALTVDDDQRSRLILQQFLPPLAMWLLPLWSVCSVVRAGQLAPWQGLLAVLFWVAIGWLLLGFLSPIGGRRNPGADAAKSERVFQPWSLERSLSLWMLPVAILAYGTPNVLTTAVVPEIYAMILWGVALLLIYLHWSKST